MLSVLGCAAVAWTPLTPPLCAPVRGRAVVCADAGPDPEEWRAFRAKLISGGLKVTGDEGGETEAAPVAKAASVAPKNEELLKEQNEELYREYFGGAWAHESPGPEAGGLVCRLPLQVQMTRLMREQPGDCWGDLMRAKLQAELPKTDIVADGADANAAEAEAEAERLLTQWSSNTVYTYRMAEGLIKECLGAVASMATDGRISIDKVTAEQRELLTLYASAQDSWQEVCLVLEGDSVGRVASKAVTINRPLAKSMNRQLAELLLNGGRPASIPAYNAAFIDRFMEAFGDEAAVYLGGPDSQESAGMCIHGFDLAGAEELAPGTRIFVGGVEAAVDAVLAGTRRPLDFRFFIGQRADVSTRDGAWGAIACARPVALKQCLGLPKPLWHEVLELCGGEMGEISKIEILKRPDIEPGSDQSRQD